MASSERSRRVRGWIVTLAVALVITCVAATSSASSLLARRAAEQDRERLTGAATEVALILSSLSADSAEASLDRLAELSTGELREEVAARRAEVLRVIDDDEVRARAVVIASGVEQDVVPRGLLHGWPGARDTEPARARLLVAVRSEVSNTRTGGADAGPGGGAGDRLWRWRLEAVIEDGRAVVSSAEVAV